MTVLRRAAGLAVMILVFAGLSTPGEAASLQAAPTAAQQTPSAIDPAVAGAVPTAPSAGFGSLADAIAAQAGAEADPTAREATRCLAAAIYFEAKGEPVDGQLAVAEVIINRAKSGRFPDDVCSVVTQRGQFSFVHAGAIPDIDDSRAAYRTAVSIARVAMANAWRSSAPRALFFHARRRPMGGRVVRVAAIGNHIFYR